MCYWSLQWAYISSYFSECVYTNCFKYFLVILNQIWTFLLWEINFFSNIGYLPLFCFIFIFSIENVWIQTYNLVCLFVPWCYSAIKILAKCLMSYKTFYLINKTNWVFLDKSYHEKCVSISLNATWVNRKVFYWDIQWLLLHLRR